MLSMTKISTSPKHTENSQFKYKRTFSGVVEISRHPPKPSLSNMTPNCYHRFSTRNLPIHFPILTQFPRVNGLLFFFAHAWVLISLNLVISSNCCYRLAGTSPWTHTCPHFIWGWKKHQLKKKKIIEIQNGLIVFYPSLSIIHTLARS